MSVQHVLTDDLFFYYLLEMACYISMTVLQFFEEKKKVLNFSGCVQLTKLQLK